MPTFRRVRRSIAALLLVLYLPGCYHYVTPKYMTPQEYITTETPRQVRVTLIDSSRIELRKPWVSADSIGGFVEAWVQSPTGVWAWGNRDSTAAVPLSSVRHLQVYTLDAGTTVAATLGGVLLVGAVVGLIVLSQLEVYS